MYSLHAMLPFVLAATAVALMMLAGLAKHTLESKQSRRICPACGRDTARGCRCRP